MDGFLVIDKPCGPSSQQVVARVKKALGLKKVGHTGTLDPLATGVLPLACGEATKVIPFLDESRKTYSVKGRLGLSTDTYDSQGAPLQNVNPSYVTSEAIERILENLMGEQAQIPPPFSAIKFQGRTLYSLARAGQKVPLQARKVFFYHLEQTAFQNPVFEIQIVCSRGTYVRSLVHDIGQILACGAHVIELRRIQTGRFTLENAVSLEKIMADPAAAKNRILSIEHCLSGLPQLNLESEREVRLVRSGVPLQRIQDLPQEGKGFFASDVLLTFEDQVIAVITLKEKEGLRYRRVLNPGG